MVKYKLPLSIVLALLLLAIVPAGIYSWQYLETPESTNVVKTNIGGISASMEFAFKGDIKGIPGEVIPVSTRNVLKKPASSGDIICKIIYNVDTGSEDLVQSISLKDGDLNGMILDPSSTDKQLIYYTSLSGAAEKNLGELCIEFKLNGNEMKSKSYSISHELIACQKSAGAVKDNMGIDVTTAKYASLMN